jgi:hypothetical protein
MLGFHEGLDFLAVNRNLRLGVISPHNSRRERCVRTNIFGPTAATTGFGEAVAGEPQTWHRKLGPNSVAVRPAKPFGSPKDRLASIRNTEVIRVNLTELFFNGEGPSVSLTSKHLAVLAGIHALGPVGACCADLQRKISADCGSQPRLATLYSILSDLEQKGLLKTVDLALPENGGRPRRLYQITKAGRRAIALGEAIVHHLDTTVAQPA